MWTKLFAYFTWDGLLSTEQYGLMYDGKAFDNAKQTKLGVIAMFKKFTGSQIMMAMSEVAPATPQMKKYFAFIMPWLGIGMPYSIDAALGLANPTATTPGPIPGAGASSLVEHPAAGSTPPAAEAKAGDSKEAKAGDSKEAKVEVKEKKA